MYPPPYTPTQSQPANYSPPPPYPGCTGKWIPAGGTQNCHEQLFDLARAGKFFFFFFLVRWSVQDSTIQKFPSGNQCNLRWCLMGFRRTGYHTKLLTLNLLCTQKALHHFKGEDHCCCHRGKPYWMRKVFPVQTPKHTFHLALCQWLMWRYSTGVNLSKNLNVNV